VIVITGLVFAIFNLDRLKRLHAVNTLFAEEKIIGNFSNMKAAFAFSPIVENGEVEAWNSALKPLPKTYKQGNATKSTSDWLEESRTSSFMVVQDGIVTHESYSLGTKPEDLRISWSIAKSFLSSAFGIAVQEGLINIDDPVDKYVPALKDSAYKGVTVRNVLNMSSGVKFDENYLDFWSDIKKMGRVLAIGGSMDEFSADVKEREREQGTAREYISIDTHILSMVLRSVTGKRLNQYIGEKIIAPIGFEYAPYYTTDSEGNAFALGGLNIATRDYARFAQMILDKGVWQGKQIVPAKWIAESTVSSAQKASNGDGWGYGYQWWIPPNSIQNGGDFIARGVYGQYLYINPKTRTVIVRTAGNRNFRKKRSDGSSAHENYVALFRAIAGSAQ
jgi:CubicO group peptidase (beta-lactamase class C family)